MRTVRGQPSRRMLRHSGPHLDIAMPQPTPLTRRLRELTRPIVVAHRGLSASYPENTLAAFHAAVAVGAEMIELDVRETRDGEVVCIHDETLDRTTDIRARTGRTGVLVRESTALDILSLDAGIWRGEAHRGARVPALREVLELVADRAVLMIEHKSGAAGPLLEVLREERMIDRVLVQSFDWEFVAELRRSQPSLTLGVLGEGPLDPARLERIDQLDVSLVHWSHADLRLDDVGSLRERGYLSCVFTADTELELSGCIGAGLDAVTTNHPDRLRALRTRRPSAP